MSKSMREVDMRNCQHEVAEGRLFAGSFKEQSTLLGVLWEASILDMHSYCLDPAKLLVNQEDYGTRWKRSFFSRVVSKWLYTLGSVLGKSRNEWKSNENSRPSSVSFLDQYASSIFFVIHPLGPNPHRFLYIKLIWYITHEIVTSFSSKLGACFATLSIIFCRITCFTFPMLDIRNCLSYISGDHVTIQRLHLASELDAFPFSKNLSSPIPFDSLFLEVLSELRWFFILTNIISFMLVCPGWCSILFSHCYSNLGFHSWICFWSSGIASDHASSFCSLDRYAWSFGKEDALSFRVFHSFHEPSKRLFWFYECKLGAAFVQFLQY